VPHKRLLEKIQGRGILGSVLNWIEDWLSCRLQRVVMQGSASSWRRITSGVLQGLVLGPVLFLIFINDLDLDLSCWVLKFADDTKIYGNVTSEYDAIQLQRDLDKVLAWSVVWQMPFNIQKCKVMHFGRHTPYATGYHMDGVQLDEVSIERDLGILWSNDGKCGTQCAQACMKANRVLGMISRTIVHKQPGIMIRLNKSLVRPLVEYCTVAWSPHYQKDKLLVERVQHRFSKSIPTLRHLGYEARLAQLGLWQLEERRVRADLIQVYKMLHGLTVPSFESFFTLATTVYQVYQNSWT